ncbi:prephenate dehydrogenase [Saccharothrix sp. HUAS TT1]|uniref:prephenate dehydrogenase n=1 Tax=unclassified Saccharothrix TaxID=2593673 RepID=UPI00345C4ACB
MSDVRLGTVAVLGAGLVGTSIGLVLRKHGISVTLADRDPESVAAAVRRGAGRASTPDEPPADLAVLAVPPAAVPAVLLRAQADRVAEWYTDVADVKTAPSTAARRLGCDMTSFVPGHPVGGREHSGAAVASGSLFGGKSWVLCPEEETADEAVRVVRELIALCEAIPVVMSAAEHDDALALVSHTPHLVAGAMAAALFGAEHRTLRLGGAGVWDVTRVAEGDPALWTEILTQNARGVATVLSEIAANLTDVAAALQLAGEGDGSFIGDVTELLTLGAAGRRDLVETVVLDPARLPAPSADLLPPVNPTARQQA